MACQLYFVNTSLDELYNLIKNAHTLEDYKKLYDSFHAESHKQHSFNHNHTILYYVNFI